MVSGKGLTGASTMENLTPQVLRPLVLEFLSKKTEGHVGEVVEGVLQLAVGKRLLSVPPGAAFGSTIFSWQDRYLFDQVQMIMWQLLPQGILVWGLGGHKSNNDEYPFYRLTEHGKEIVKDSAAKPQPYDPDGFLKEFKRLVPDADPIVVDYLEEAVRAFNAACYKSAAVMLGAASEKLTLLLHEKFEDKITDPTKKAKFTKDSEGIAVSKKFDALKNRLDLMDGAKRFKDHHELRGTIRHDLPAVSEVIRRCRNDAGHPDIPTQTDPDTVFLNLRVFSEHARKLYELLHYFDTSPADW